MNQRQNRREFLKSTVAAGVMTGLYLNPGSSRAGDSPNEKLNIACVGTQNRAAGNIDDVSSQNLVAFADVDSNYLAQRLSGVPGARGYADFRVMLEKESDKIDAVVVATADHTHAPAAAMALKLGKHVYCEKPLTHTIWEARKLAELARENKRVTQMGTQIHATDNYRRVVELVQSGAIGPVTETHIWCGKGWSNGRFNFQKETPANLNWDLWLGPAEARDYSTSVHPGNWRRFWDFGSGTLGDMGCHVMDLAFWALNLRHPTKVSAEGPEVHPVGTPSWIKAHYSFPARGDMPETALHWYDGDKQPELLQKIKADGGPDLTGSGLGVLFVGKVGMLYADYGSRVLIPLDKFAGFKAPEQTIPASVGHHAEWIQACKTGGSTTCNFDYSGALTETVLLGTVAYRVGKTLEWNAAELKATNCPEADQFITKQYRKGWEV